MENTFANALKIFGVGFTLVIVIMIALAGIMEFVGKVVGKYEKKKEAAKK
jgi:Na+-transporting methylmalonyl-CoA/oxaloacetate decarboxylase gamma subunit